MQKKRNRAWRRKQNQKSIKKAFNIFKYQDYWSEDLKDEDYKVKAKKNHDNMTFCSNPFCCGNPRRTKGRKVLTRKETLSIIDLRQHNKEED